MLQKSKRQCLSFHLREPPYWSRFSGQNVSVDRTDAKINEDQANTARIQTVIDRTLTAYKYFFP